MSEGPAAWGEGERRRHQRIAAGMPLEVAASSTRRLWGRLLDGSRGGLSFATEDDVELGERLEIAVNRLDGSSCLSGVRVLVVDKHLWEGDQVAHCAFDGPPGSAAWLRALRSLS